MCKVVNWLSSDISSGLCSTLPRFLISKIAVNSLLKCNQVHQIIVHIIPVDQCTIHCIWFDSIRMYYKNTSWWQLEMEYTQQQKQIMLNSFQIKLLYRNVVSLLTDNFIVKKSYYVMVDKFTFILVDNRRL